MAIYSAKYAKELVAESMRLDPTYVCPARMRIFAILKGERKERIFQVTDLLADGGRQEVQAAMAALRSKASDTRAPAAPKVVA